MNNQFNLFSGKKFLTALLLGLLNNNLYAAEAEKTVQENVIVTNNLFWILLIIILLLLFFITSLSNALKNLSQINLKDYKEKPSKPKVQTNVIIGVIAFTATFMGNFSLKAQETVEAEASSSFLSPKMYGGLSPDIFWIMIIAIVFELIVVFILIGAIQKMLSMLNEASGLAQEKSISVFNFSRLSASINDAVPIEKEQEIMTDHEYDGIRELDNNLPPWWKYGFYLTIVVSIVYLLSYHVFQTSPLQLEEYQREMDIAALEKEAYLKSEAGNINENNVTLVTTADGINSGKNIYKDNCAACHGQAGEGTVGPNLTDEYWLHGGGVKNIFKTIKYGVPAKGMIAWQAQLTPVQIQQVSSFIVSLKGTNPPGAKEPQGDLFKEDDLPQTEK